MANGKDVFGYKRNRKVDGVFSTDDSWLHIGGQTDAQGYLVQSWQVAYNQDVVEVFELGSNALYWAKGRPTGAGSLSRIVGIKDAEAGSTGLFPSNAYDICEGGALLEMKVRGGSCPPKPGVAGVTNATGVALSMDGCVITAIGFQASVADTRVMEAVSWRFGFLEIKPLN